MTNHSERLQKEANITKERRNKTVIQLTFADQRDMIVKTLSR